MCFANCNAPTRKYKHEISSIPLGLGPTGTDFVLAAVGCFSFSSCCCCSRFLSSIKFWPRVLPLLLLIIAILSNTHSCDLRRVLFLPSNRCVFVVKMWLQLSSWQLNWIESLTCLSLSINTPSELHFTHISRQLLQRPHFLCLFAVHGWSSKLRVSVNLTMKNHLNESCTFTSSHLISPYRWTLFSIKTHLIFFPHPLSPTHCKLFWLCLYCILSSLVWLGRLCRSTDCIPEDLRSFLMECIYVSSRRRSLLNIRAPDQTECEMNFCSRVVEEEWVFMFHGLFSPLLLATTCRWLDFIEWRS